MAKEKEVSGVNDEPREGSAEGRDDSEASRQPAENGHSKGDLKAEKKADAETTGETSEAVAAAGEGYFCMSNSVSLHGSQYPLPPLSLQKCFKIPGSACVMTAL